MKIFALIVLVLCTGLDARAADDKTPVANLTDGRAGVIRFESLTPSGYFQLARKETTRTSVIAGTLTLPPGRGRARPGHDHLPRERRHPGIARGLVGGSVCPHGHRGLRGRQLWPPQCRPDGDRPVAAVYRGQRGRRAGCAQAPRHASSDRSRAYRRPRLLQGWSGRPLHGARALPAGRHRR